MLPRFLAPDVDTAGTRVALTVEEADHLVRVLRLRVGARVRLFNGRGGEFEGTVEFAQRGRVHVTVEESCVPTPEAHVRLTLAQAVLKGDKMDEVVRNAVMLGAAAIQPVLSARCEASAAALTRGQRRERWERIAVSAAKQSGRALVPPIYEPCRFDELLLQIGARVEVPAPAIMLVEPGAVVSQERGCGPAAQAATLLVGPEGGWATEEILQARGRCRVATFGGRTLRADAAGLIAMTAVLALWDGF